MGLVKGKRPADEEAAEAEEAAEVEDLVAGTGAGGVNGSV